VSNTIVIPPPAPPVDWSKFEKTGNKAIDLVAVAIGYHKQTRKPLKAVVLRETYYDLFKIGAEVLAKQRFEDPATELTFDGIQIKRGQNMHFESIRFEYYEMPIGKT
jgi:hypothetical protein